MVAALVFFLTSEVGDHRGEDEGEGGEGERDELPAAVEPAVLPQVELLPAKKAKLLQELAQTIGLMYLGVECTLVLVDGLFETRGNIMSHDLL